MVQCWKKGISKQMGMSCVPVFEEPFQLPPLLLLSDVSGFESPLRFLNLLSDVLGFEPPLLLDRISFPGKFSEEFWLAVRTLFDLVIFSGCSGCSADSLLKELWLGIFILGESNGASKSVADLLSKVKSVIGGSSLTMGVTSDNVSLGFFSIVEPSLIKSTVSDFSFDKFVNSKLSFEISVSKWGGLVTGGEGDGTFGGVTGVGGSGRNFKKK